MHKKSFIVILSTMLAVMVASVTLVFTVGPMISADNIVIIDDVNCFDVDENGVLSSIARPDGIYGDGSHLHIILPNNVVRIKDSCVCGYITQIDFNNGLQQIDANAFQYMGFVNLIFPESLKTIGECAFYSSTELESVYIPASVEYIGESVFTSAGGGYDWQKGKTTIYCACSEEYANTHWAPKWKEGFYGEIIWDYVPPVENKNNNTLTIAIAGGVGGTVGLGTIGTIVGVVVHKKRKLK